MISQWKKWRTNICNFSCKFRGHANCACHAASLQGLITNQTLFNIQHNSKKYLLRLLHNVAKHFMKTHLNFTRGESSFNLIYFAMSVQKNQSKFQLNDFLLVAIQTWMDFYTLTRQKDNFLNRLFFKGTNC